MKERVRKMVEGAAPRTIGDQALAAGLSVAASGYGAAMRARAGLYSSGILKSHAVDCPVVCVGNLTVGGSGKTPTVAALAQLLCGESRRPAIVSRGYGATGRDAGACVVVSAGQGPTVGPEIAGDEPWLLSMTLPETPIVVGADRHSACRTAIERFDPDLIILDDGFQRIQLKRDFNLVLLDVSRDPWSLNLFPRGPLRESFDALKRAHAIGLTRWETGEHQNAWRKILRSRAAHCSVVNISMRPTALGMIPDLKEEESIECLRNRKAFAVSAIARPDGFAKLLRECGAEIVGERHFRDHYIYAADDLHRIEKEANEASAELIVTTDKDAVKWRRFPEPMIPARTLRIAARFDERFEPIKHTLTNLPRSR